MVMIDVLARMDGGPFEPAIPMYHFAAKQRFLPGTRD
jgi:hypothetical protein